ncbi:F0F1 ATP synthase subunit A [Neolewinella lacunae]|uniref:ATP synthase subunit a n=1 Tax=Neolewinella lacunae TaxID=1517758 RepID=A0A923PK58_9BACT|nr:F0F1 ATP synthase subunit A [Neolewinella lacunae]MBC6993196.1 F0F1 ATP synthase subunit A [Neolewinella lacunae]MDN3637115.1 F0F1 ATP synthase subunit A [Neolewinella lacunae]
MKLTMRLLFLLIFGLTTTGVFASGEQPEPTEQDSGAHGEEATYDPVTTIMGHISDANEFHLWGHVSIPLPIILYAPDQGFTFGLSSMFHHGETAVDGYVLNHGRVNRVVDRSFPTGHVDLGEHAVHMSSHEVDGKERDLGLLSYNGQEYELEQPSTLDGGLVGGGITSFYDFSITKNVFTMLLAAFLLVLVWGSVRRSYEKNEGKAPSGLQSLLEPLFVFIRDEVTRPMIGEKHYERFQPFIMSLFFFILFCNLFGLIPIFPGSANVTGNIAVTLCLAFLVFLVTNLNGNRHYWGHIFAMPGVPKWVLIILTPVELLGLIIKPFSLMIRLFANIAAGHIIILSLIGLIFLFGNNGESVAGAGMGAVVGTAFTAFMNLIELLVAFLQAFIFSILAASYIGAAVEDHEHHGHEHHDEEEAHGYAAAVKHQH